MSVGKTTVVVRLGDGSSMKILRRWTDVDGVACGELAGDSVLSLRGLRELLGLFTALRARTGRQAAIAGGMIKHARSNGEAVDDDQTERIGVPRDGVSRGAVGAVAGTLIPSLRATTDAEKRLPLFEQLEGKFAFQAKLVTLITGLTGFYMLEYMGAWDRYLQAQFWWIHLMTLVWLIFTIVLLVLEPLFLHRRFNKLATENSERAFSLLHRMHKILLALSLITVFVTVAAVHGLALI